jgi:glycosyltransferase involved in cell wall biosynthesis
MTRAVVISFRIGGADGVSVEIAKWHQALLALGYEVAFLAGQYSAFSPDLPPAEPEWVIDPGLGVGSSVSGVAAPPPDPHRWRTLLASADLVVADNILSLPLNPAATTALSAALAGRPTVVRHHDLPWERARFAASPPPPDDPAWIHVTVSRGAAQALSQRGVGQPGRICTVYNAFDPNPRSGEREATRAALGVAEGETLVLQPTRAIPRKDVPAGLALAQAAGATFWLTGAAEEGYGPELGRLLGDATVPVCHRSIPSMADAYAASDLVVFPSRWEGFGNPPVEASAHGRGVAVGPYPVGAELRSLGFRWLEADDHSAVRDWLRHPDPLVLEHNRRVVARHLSTADLPARLAPILERARRGVGPLPGPAPVP